MCLCSCDNDRDAGPISDDELTIAGAELFAMYDAEEDASGDTQTLGLPADDE